MKIMVGTPDEFTVLFNQLQTTFFEFLTKKQEKMLFTVIIYLF